MPFSPFDPRRPAKTSYSNADLPDFARTPLGTTVEQVGDPSPTSVIPDEEFNQAYGDREAILNGAKAALAQGNRISGWLDQQSQQPDEATLALSQEVPSALDSPMERFKKLAMHYIKTRPEALEKGAYAGAMSFPALAIPSEAYLAARSVNRLAQGEDETTLGKVADVAQAALSGSAAVRGLRGAIGGLKAAQNPVARGLNQFFTGHPEATSPAGGALLREVDAGRQAESAAAAGEQASMRMQARELGRTGYSPAAVQKVTGLHPNAPRSISIASPISHLTQVAETPYEKEAIETAMTQSGFSPSVAGRVSGTFDDPIMMRQFGVGAPGQTRPAYEGLLQALESDPLEKFASGPRIERGLGSRTPEQAALYEKALSKGEGPAENVAAKITERPRTTTNASGESMASQEAMNRQASMKAKGEQFVVMDRAGNMRPLIGPEAVDYVPRPGEKYGTFSKHGFKLLQEGGKRAARR